MKLYKFEKIAGIQPSKDYLRNPKYQFEKIAAVATPYTTKVSKPSNKSNPTDMLPSNPQQPSITFGAGGSPMEGFLYPESPAAMAYRQKLDNRAQSQAIANARANIIGRATTQPVARKPNITRFEDLPQSSMKDKAFAYMDTLDQQGGSTSQGIRMPGFGNNNSFPSMYRPYVQPWQQQAPPLPQQPAPQSNFDLLASQPNPTNNIEIADSRIRNQGLLGQQRMDARNDALIRQQEQERARQQQALQQWGNLSRKELEGMGFDNPQDWYSKTPEQRRQWFKQRQDNRLADTRGNIQNQFTTSAGARNGDYSDMQDFKDYKRQQEALWGKRWRANGKTQEEIDDYINRSYGHRLDNYNIDRTVKAPNMSRSFANLPKPVAGPTDNGLAQPPDIEGPPIGMDAIKQKAAPIIAPIKKSIEDKAKQLGPKGARGMAKIKKKVAPVVGKITGAIKDKAQQLGGLFFRGDDPEVESTGEPSSKSLNGGYTPRTPNPDGEPYYPFFPEYM